MRTKRSYIINIVMHCMLASGICGGKSTVAPLPDQLAHGATALRMTQKDLLAEAVREYLTARRDQINAALQEAMNILDGAASSHVTALTGLSAERLAELGGVREQ